MKMESFEKSDEYGYKYDFLADKNINDDVGFIPHCNRPDWGKSVIETENLLITFLSTFEIINIFFNSQYGKITRIIHLHKKGKVKRHRKVCRKIKSFTNSAFICFAFVTGHRKNV